MENVEHHVGAAIHEHHVTTDDDVGAARRRRRKAALQFGRARQHLLAQTWRQRSAHTQLLFESGIQAVTLVEPGLKEIILIAIPTAHFVAVVVAVVVTVVVAILILTVVFAVASAMAVLVVGYGRARESKHYNRRDIDPPFDSHGNYVT